MTDNEIIKALEYCSDEGRKNCKNCPIYKITNCFGTLSGETVDLINRQQAENDDLFYKLTGVMHSIDKWLDGDELKQDEVNQAATMREKTLRLIESAKAEAMTEFADRLQFRCIKQDGCLWSSDIGAELKEILEKE